MARHKLTHAEEVKGGKDSHKHHKKMHDHHMAQAKKHASHLHKMAKEHEAAAGRKYNRSKKHERAEARAMR